MKSAASTKYVLFDTALGTCGLVWGEAGLCRVVLPEPNRARAEARVRERFEDAIEAPPPREVTGLVRQLSRQLEGGPPARCRMDLDLRGASAFARKIYDALRQVPVGETVTYGELATRAGSPGAARAVGRAMAHNPLPLLIPCHRVIGANGRPGGFTAYGGVATKAELLALEGVRLDNGALPFDAKEACRHLRRSDPRLAALMKRVGPPRLSLERRKSTFATLARAIVYQQLTGRAAATIFGRVVGLFPGRRTLRAEDVAASSDAELRSAGLSRAKAAALRDLADKTLGGALPSRRKLDGMADDAIVEALTQVRGVGRWTVEMLLIFQLGRPDVLADGDYALRKAFSAELGLPEVATAKELAAYGERWQPYRTMACWYLWRSLELP